MELTDGTITLRPPADGDVDAIVDAVRSSPEVARWMPWAADYDQTRARAWVSGELDPTEHRFVILDPDGGLVGSCGLNQAEETNRLANLGYWLRTDATGQGWATRATRLLARHGFEVMGLHRIEIVMPVGNEPSRRVAERAGAHYEGVLRGRLLVYGEHLDCHSYSILATDGI